MTTVQIFAGLYDHKKYDDPICVKSRTGFVITINDASVVAKSSLQKIVVENTIETEMLALAQNNKTSLCPTVDCKVIRWLVAL